MIEIFGVPLVALTGQIMLGIVNGAFYAVLSLGLAVIFASGIGGLALAPKRQAA